MLLLALGTAASSVAVALVAGQAWFLVAIFLFGASVMPLYAMSLATAADVCEASEFVTIGTSVLLLNALGAAFAPILLGQLMAQFQATALFWAFAGIALVLSGYIAMQLRVPRAVAVSEQTPFEVAAADAAPAAFEMDPRTQEDSAESEGASAH